MFSAILALSLTGAGSAPDSHHLFHRGGCAGIAQSAGCSGAVASRAGCSGSVQAAGCHGAVAVRTGCHGSQVSISRTVTRTRAVTAPVAVVPVAVIPATAVPAPVAVAAPVPPPPVQAPPLPMQGPGNAYVVPRATPVRDAGFFVADRTRLLFGRVARGGCAGGNCGR